MQLELHLIVSPHLSTHHSDKTPYTVKQKDLLVKVSVFPFQIDSCVNISRTLFPLDCILYSILCICDRSIIACICAVLLTVSVKPRLQPSTIQIFIHKHSKKCKLLRNKVPNQSIKSILPNYFVHLEMHQRILAVYYF